MPVASVQTDIFAPALKNVARTHGMPRLRYVYVPQPVMGKSPAELRAYIDGNDPITGRPVMTEVIEALTRPLDAEDRAVISYDRGTSRFCEPDTKKNLRALFEDGVLF